MIEFSKSLLGAAAIPAAVAPPPRPASTTGEDPFTEDVEEVLAGYESEEWDIDEE